MQDLAPNRPSPEPGCIPVHMSSSNNKSGTADLRGLGSGRRPLAKRACEMRWHRDRARFDSGSPPQRPSRIDPKLPPDALDALAFSARKQRYSKPQPQAQLPSSSTRKYDAQTGKMPKQGKGTPGRGGAGRSDLRGDAEGWQGKAPFRSSRPPKWRRRLLIS